ARVTFFDVCSEAYAENRAAEWLAKAEAAARAHGVPCGRVSCNAAHVAGFALETIVELARAQGCDLLCAPCDAPWLARRWDAGDPIIPGGMSVRICTAQRHRSADLAIGKLLGQHRAVGAQLHRLLGDVRKAVMAAEPHDEAFAATLAAALHNVLALRERAGN